MQRRDAMAETIGCSPCGSPLHQLPVTRRSGSPNDPEIRASTPRSVLLTAQGLTAQGPRHAHCWGPAPAERSMVIKRYQLHVRIAIAPTASHG